MGSRRLSPGGSWDSFGACHAAIRMSNHSSDRGARAEKTHFAGLDSLRFFAAAFVVVGHAALNQQSVGLPDYSRAAFFFRGATAVSFFFTLSGFLITYLLLEEHRRTGTVSVRRFYLRRVCRIWPVYFAVVLFGLAFYNLLLPALSIPYRVEYQVPVALGLYTLFLPNLMNSLYTVGGILNPSWSIGVEEQFYLTWAPAFRRFRGVLPQLCATVLAAFLGVSVLNHFRLFGAGWAEKLVGQLEFHFMAAGALCAYWLHAHPKRMLALPVFRSRVIQVALFLLLAELYLVGRIPWGWLGQEVVQVVLYCWLILTVAANPRNVVKLHNRAFEYLGKVSYGIYMFHMIAVYAASWLFLRTSWWHGRPAAFYPAYYALVFAVTILLAYLSYRYFETPFLRLKNRRYASLRSQGTAQTPLLPAADRGVAG